MASHLRKSALLAALTFAIGVNVNASAATIGFDLYYSGYPGDTEDYAFAFPTFKFVNTSSTGISITSMVMDDGTAVGLWDYVSDEISSGLTSFTLTQGDRTNDSGWTSNIAYSFVGMDNGDFMQFSVDPDTLHSGTGNVVDSRPFLFGAGSITATFSNAQTLTLTWPSEPTVYVFDPLRKGNNSTDLRNIYYKLGGERVLTDTPTTSVPEPTGLALLGLGLAGLGLARRQKA